MITGARRAVVVATSALLAVGACSNHPLVTAPPQAPLLQQRPPPSTPRPAAPKPIAPQGDPTPPTRCPLTLRVEIHPLNDGRHELTVFAESAIDSTQELELPDRCPQGLVDFDGLGTGYDYYGVCAAGACPGTRSPQHIRVAPGERVPIAATTISTRGGAGCTKPLAQGRYTIRPRLPPQLQACVVPALLEVRDGGAVPAPPHVTSPPAPSRPAPPPSPSPAPPVPSPSLVRPPPPPPAPPQKPVPIPAPTGAIGVDIYSCVTPSDCVLSCPKVTGCCSSSCGCRHAINKAHRANYEASYKNTCQKPPMCPAEACAYNPAMGVDCRGGRCVATDHP